MLTAPRPRRASLPLLRGLPAAPGTGGGGAPTTTTNLPPRPVAAAQGGGGAGAGTASGQAAAAAPPLSGHFVLPPPPQVPPATAATQRWTKQQVAALARMHKHAAAHRVTHEAAANWCHTMRLRISLPAYVLHAVSTCAALTAAQQSSNGALAITFAVLAAVISASNLVLSAVSEYLGFSQQEVGHRAAADAFSSLARAIAHRLLRPVGDFDGVLAEVDEAYDHTKQASPPVPPHLAAATTVATAAVSSAGGSAPHVPDTVVQVVYGQDGSPLLHVTSAADGDGGSDGSASASASGSDGGHATPRVSLFVREEGDTTDVRPMPPPPQPRTALTLPPQPPKAAAALGNIVGTARSTGTDSGYDDSGSSTHGQLSADGSPSC